VLLDLQRDKYVGVDREQMSSLAARVKGWPLPGAAPSAESAADTVRAPDARADAVVGKMLAAGMLTTDPAVGKEATPVEMPRAEAALVEEDLETRPAITFNNVSRFLRATAMTALALRLRSIESVIAGVAASKAAARAKGAPLEMHEARRAVAAFVRLRPLLFGAQDACLFDSLALMRFLSYYGCFPTCVIGVQTGPFGAHCWIQHGAVVFNDAPEYVRRYTPILAV
jgi:Transglutaminase-like superfamily